jgi:putative transposase
LEWSSQKYGFGEGGLDDGKEETNSRRDYSKAAADGCAFGTGQAGCERGTNDRGDGIKVYRWRDEYGGLKGDQVKRSKELETENGWLRRAVSDPTLDKLILTEAAKGSF